MAEQELPSNAVMHAPRLGKSRISRSTLTKRTQVCIEICCQPAYFALISAINMLARNVERHNFARLHVSCKPWQHFCNETRVTSAVLRCVRWLQGRRASKPVKEDRLQPAAGGRAGDGSWSVSRCTRAAVSRSRMHAPSGRAGASGAAISRCTVRARAPASSVRRMSRASSR